MSFQSHKSILLQARAFGALMLLSTWALVVAAPLGRYAEVSSADGQFFRNHHSEFAPLYALLYAQGSFGVTLMLIAITVYSALALLYWALLRNVSAAPELVALLWRSRMHWLMVGSVWLGWSVVYPLLSDDALSYLIQAHQLWSYGVNPYLVGEAYGGLNDSWSLLLGPLQHFPFTYGPLALYLCLPAVMVSPGSLAGALVLLRLTNIGLLVGCVTILWYALADQPRAERQLWMLALIWHPLIVLEAIWSAHNDVAMMLCVLAALMAFRRKHIPFAAWLIACGVATKYIPVLLIPLIGAAALRQSLLSRQLWRTWMRAIAGSVLLLGLLYAPVAWQEVTAILAGLRSHAAKINPSLGALVQTYGAALIGTDGARSIAPALLLALTAWATWRVWRGAALADMLIIVFVLYIFMVSPWYVPWYGLWLLLLAPLGQPWLRRSAFLTTLLLPLYYVVNIVPLPAWLLVLCNAGLPLVLFAIAWCKQQRLLANTPPAVAQT